MVGTGSFLTDAIFGHLGMRRRFNDAALAAAMVRVEIALAEVQAELDIIPVTAAEAISSLPERAALTPANLAAGVAQSGVPVPAMVAALRASLSPEEADWLHFGATSQDIIDTALCLCYRTALDDLERALGQVIDMLAALSMKHKDTLMLGRTRGQLATPITFGIRAAQWAQPLIALEAEFPVLKQSAQRVQLGGATGSGSVFGDRGRQVAALLAERLGLANSPPWHTDRRAIRGIAHWLANVIAASAKIGGDVALMARGDIAEAGLAQAGGSSTIPHKSNPVTAEALQSLMAVAVASKAGLAATTIHAEERDGANWSAEWALMPPLFEAAGAALRHSRTLLDGLEVNTEAMATRITATPEVKAEAAVFALAARVVRAEASRIVAVALASGEPLATALASHTEVDWQLVLSEAAFTKPAAQIASDIFAARRPARDHG